MVQQAQRRFWRQIAEGRIQMQLGSVPQLSFPDASFDRILTINTIYFWPDASRARRNPQSSEERGRRCSLSLPREKMEKYAAKYDFTLLSPDEVANLMRQVGFRDI
jgi:hypothetical protein